MDLVALHRRSVEGFDARVGAIAKDQWDAPTACAEWSVRDLVNHIVNESLWTPELLAGKTVEEIGDRFDGDLLGADPAGAWERSSQSALAAVAGVGDLTVPVNVSWGQIPARDYITQLTLDYTVHAWDLATGIGADTDLDQELTRFAWDYSASQKELIRASGVFGDEVSVPDDADTQTKLLAILGRQR